MVAMAVRHRPNNGSMSSMGIETDPDSEFDHSENLFGLEEDELEHDATREEAIGYDDAYSDSGLESLSTPVMMTKSSRGRFGFLNSRSVTPSPRKDGDS